MSSAQLAELEMSSDSLRHAPFAMSRHKTSENRRKFLILVGLVMLVLFSSLFAFHRRDQFTELLNHNPWPVTPASRTAALSPAASPVASPPATKPISTLAGTKSLSETSLKDLRNSTLGFQKVFVVNLPGRSDKLDAISMLASLTGFSFDVMEGVQGADVPPKALPGEFKDTPLKLNIIGCWRAHMNFARRIIRDRLSSALVIEDDSDWDVDLKAQLERFALGSQHLLNSFEKQKPPHSPYGDDWDLLWLGHCSSGPDKEDNRRFVIENDPTVAPPQHRMNYGKTPDMNAYSNSTRIVFKAISGVCTYAYALSFRGAQKFLYHTSMSIYGKPVDLGLSDMCWNKDRNFRCIGTFPQLIDTHKPAGSMSKDSDIGQGDTTVRKKGFTHNIVHSMRLNVAHLINEEMDKIEVQWKDVKPLDGPIRLSWKSTNESVAK